MNNYKYIVIGGSAGSFQVITKILGTLPKNYKPAVILVLHRLKHVRNGFVEALSLKSKLPIIEPEDKSPIRSGNVYLAPANYHLQIELGNFFALSAEEPVNHSRPSIDLSFETAAYAFKDKMAGIILSGANRDGAKGLQEIYNNGGATIIQDPEECQVKTMTLAAIERVPKAQILSVDSILDFLLLQNK